MFLFVVGTSQLENQCFPLGFKLAFSGAKNESLVHICPYLATKCHSMFYWLWRFVFYFFPPCSCISLVFSLCIILPWSSFQFMLLTWSSSTFIQFRKIFHIWIPCSINVWKFWSFSIKHIWDVTLLDNNRRIYCRKGLVLFGDGAKLFGIQDQCNRRDQRAKSILTSAVTN